MTLEERVAMLEYQLRKINHNKERPAYIRFRIVHSQQVTLDHPTKDATPDNWEDLAVGVVFNAQRGRGHEDDMLFADLMLTDAKAVEDALEEGLEGVSVRFLSRKQEATR